MCILKFNLYNFSKNKTLRDCILYNPFNFPELFYSTKIIFDPSLNNLTSYSKNSSFFKKYVSHLFFFNSFLNVNSKMSNLYFHRLEKSGVRFRKRNNIFFTVIAKATPTKRNSFFLQLPRFIDLMNLLSKQLYFTYKLKSGIFQVKRTKKTIVFYFLNPHYVWAFMNNSKVDKTKLIVKLHILKTEKFVIRKLFALLNEWSV